MGRSILDRSCFVVCVLCIFAGVVLGLAMIWLPTLSDILWKGLATVGVVFLGASSVLSLSRAYSGRDTPPGGRSF